MCKHLPTALTHVIEALEPNIGIRETFGARHQEHKIAHEKSHHRITPAGLLLRRLHSFLLSLALMESLLMKRHPLHHLLQLLFANEQT